MSSEFYNPFTDFNLDEIYRYDEDKKKIPGKFDRKNFERAIEHMCSLPDVTLPELSTQPFSDLLQTAWDKLSPQSGATTAPDTMMQDLYDQGDILLGFWKGYMMRLLDVLPANHLPPNFKMQANDDNVYFNITGEHVTSPRISYELSLDQPSGQHNFKLGFFTKYQVPDWMSTATISSKIAGKPKEEFKAHFRGKFDLVYFVKRIGLEGEDLQGMQKTEFLQFPVR